MREQLFYRFQTKFSNVKIKRMKKKLVDLIQRQNIENFLRIENTIHVPHTKTIHVHEYY